MTARWCRYLVWVVAVGALAACSTKPVVDCGINESCNVTGTWSLFASGTTTGGDICTLIDTRLVLQQGVDAVSNPQPFTGTFDQGTLECTSAAGQVIISTLLQGQLTGTAGPGGAFLPLGFDMGQLALHFDGSGVTRSCTQAADNMFGSTWRADLGGSIGVVTFVTSGGNWGASRLVNC